MLVGNLIIIERSISKRASCGEDDIVPCQFTLSQLIVFLFTDELAC